jgi:predicted GTPase
VTIEPGAESVPGNRLLTPSDPRRGADPGLLSGPCERLAQIVDDVLPSLSVPSREQLAAVRDALREPVRIAVAGRVNAGKSTLVNSLIGQGVAPTDVSECTQVISWFRYGHPERVDVVLNDGTRVEQRLSPDGHLPSTLGVDLTEVHHLDVWLSNQLLQSMSLVDTPGLGSLNQEFSQATEVLLNSSYSGRDLSSAVDALVFLVNGEVKSDELASLRAFRATSGGLGGSTTNVVGVLSKVDKLANGSDWWDVGERLAKRIAEDLVDDLITVSPLATLMAETSETAALSEHDVDNLRSLAEMDPDEWSLLAISSSEFVEGRAPVSEPDRERLIALLDLSGIGEAIDLIHDGTRGAIPLRRALSGRSGINQLREILLAEFRGHGGVLKIRTAFRMLDRFTYRPPTERDVEPLRRLRDQVERLRLEPDLHGLAELEALHSIESRETDLPDELEQDIRRLVTTADPAERVGALSADPLSIQAAAVAGVARWRRFEFGPAVTPRVRQIAHTVKRSYSLAWEATQPASTVMTEPDGGQE